MNARNGTRATRACQREKRAWFERGHIVTLPPDFSLSPIGGEGWGEGAGRPLLQQALFSVRGYPLIPTFSPKGEKESDAHTAHERAGRSGSLAFSSLGGTRGSVPAVSWGSVNVRLAKSAGLLTKFSFGLLA
jgi:hypothetical protein